MFIWNFYQGIRPRLCPCSLACRSGSSRSSPARQNLRNLSRPRTLSCLFRKSRDTILSVCGDTYYGCCHVEIQLSLIPKSGQKYDIFVLRATYFVRKYSLGANFRLSIMLLAFRLVVRRQSRNDRLRFGQVYPVAEQRLPGTSLLTPSIPGPSSCDEPSDPPPKSHLNCIFASRKCLFFSAKLEQTLVFRSACRIFLAESCSRYAEFL